MAPTATGQSIPQQEGQGAPARVLERSPMESMMGPEQAQQIATAPGQVENLPNMPRPPAPFENAPISPQEMLPG